MKARALGAGSVSGTALEARLIQGSDQLLRELRHTVTPCSAGKVYSMAEKTVWIVCWML